MPPSIRLCTRARRARTAGTRQLGEHREGVADHRIDDSPPQRCRRGCFIIPPAPRAPPQARPSPSSVAASPVNPCQRLDGDIDVGRVELQPEADPAAGLGGDHAGARTDERIVDRLAGARCCSASAAASARRASACRAPSRVLVAARHLPERGLLAIAVQFALPLSRHVPAWLVLPVVVAAARAPAAPSPR